ncbi:MAG: factor-independent urate hydroxylase [Micromonosporaceae bacterium]
MMISLGANEYGKAEIRLVRVARDTERHELTDLTVGVALAGDFEAAHVAGDNRAVLPTDTQKNTVYAFAQDPGIGEIEDFGLLLARHFVQSQPAVARARISIEQHPWERLAPHSFRRRGGEIRTATVTADASGAWVVSGLTDLVVLNTTRSEFVGFATDRFTTLAEASDRILATSVTARWRHAEPTGDWAASYSATRELLLSAFAGTYSRSLQETLYAMGRHVLEHRPELAEVRLSMPNRHHFAVDLAPFGLDNRNEVFHADDRPYGLIEGGLVREGAPPAGPAWQRGPEEAT